MTAAKIAFLCVGLVCLVVLCIVGLFVGKPCINSKCSRFAKKGHAYCPECEARAGIDS